MTKKDRFRTLPMYTDEDLNLVENLLSQVRTVADTIGFNPFDNYKYREMGMLRAAKTIVPDILPVAGREREDATSEQYRYIELKSYKNLNGILKDSTICGEFDIRSFYNKELRVMTVDDYNMFVFGLYRQHTLFPHTSIVIHETTSVEQLKTIINDRADTIMKFMDETKKSKRNSLKIKYEDIKSLNTYSVIKYDEGVFSAETF